MQIKNMLKKRTIIGYIRMRRRSDEKLRKDGRKKNLLISCALGGKGIFSLLVFNFVLC